MRPASASPRSVSACPVTSSSVGSPPASTRAARSTAAAEKSGCCASGGTSAMPSASFHAVSAGRISVAICGGALRAAAMAAAPSRATILASGEVRTQADIGRASPSMSDVSGAL